MVINVDPVIKTRIYDSEQVTKGYVNKLDAEDSDSKSVNTRSLLKMYLTLLLLKNI